mgnify:CR=1 FL=1
MCWLILNFFVRNATEDEDRTQNKEVKKDEDKKVVKMTSEEQLIVWSDMPLTNSSILIENCDFAFVGGT